MLLKSYRQDILMKMSLSALLADVEKNELDGDNADTENKRLIKKLEQKLLDIIKKNDLKESVKENDPLENL